MITGLHWNNIPAADNFSSFVFDPNDPNIIYEGSFTGKGLYKSWNGGYTWTNYTTGISTIGIIWNWINTIVIHPKYNNIVYMATMGNGVMKSRDYGVTWESMNNGLGKSYIDSLAYDSSINKLFAETVVVSGFDIPAGLWMYQDIDVGPPPVAFNKSTGSFMNNRFNCKLQTLNLSASGIKEEVA